MRATGTGRRRGRLAAIGVAALLVAAAAGCGEKDEPEVTTPSIPTITTPTVPTTPTTPAPTPTQPAPKQP